MSRGRRTPGALELLAEVLADHQDCPDAACVGEHAVFDRARWPEDAADHADHLQARADAARICATCPHIGCADRIGEHQQHQNAA